MKRKTIKKIILIPVIVIIILSMGMGMFLSLFLTPEKYNKNQVATPPLANEPFPTDIASSSSEQLPQPFSQPAAPAEKIPEFNLDLGQ